MKEKNIKLNENTVKEILVRNTNKEYKIKFKDHKGITLIALIITIILMIILVGVSIILALKGGLFSTSKKAKNNTQRAINEEHFLANGRVKINEIWYNSIEDYLAGNKSNNQYDTPIELPEGIKVGDYVNYTPDIGEYKVANSQYGSGYDSVQTFTTETGENALKWRILSIDEETGKIELVSEKVGQATTNLCLKGVDGYNHGVDILNDLCKTLYSKTIDGNEIAVGRSLNVEDINAKIKGIYLADSAIGSSSYNYNDKIKISTKYSEVKNRKYPNLYAKEDGYYDEEAKQEGGISESTGLNDGVVNDEKVTEYKTVTGYTDDYDFVANKPKKDIYVTHTYYICTLENYLNDDLGINKAPKGLINVKESYWLASRSVSIGSYGIDWRIRNVDTNRCFEQLPVCSVLMVMLIINN